MTKKDNITNDDLQFLCADIWCKVKEVEKRMDRLENKLNNILLKLTKKKNKGKN